jgi:hypothetical protein
MFRGVKGVTYNTGISMSRSRRQRFMSRMK